MSLEQHLIVTAVGTLTAFFLIVTLVSESRERQNIGNHGRSKSSRVHVTSSVRFDLSRRGIEPHLGLSILGSIGTWPQSIHKASSPHDQTADPSTAPLARKRREASLRMTRPILTRGLPEANISIRPWRAEMAHVSTDLGQVRAEPELIRMGAARSVRPSGALRDSTAAVRR
jgi:hypothetical protein